MFSEMASVDLRDELTCSICLNMYMDPVTLTCGHSFCRTCIGDVLDTQDGSGAYKCPESSLCDKHLKKHSKSEEHVLTEPTTSLENRKCSVHKKVLEYYCCEDTTCICVSCRLDGEHRGHKVETLNEASEKKKETLRNILQNLTSQREKAKEKVQNLEKLRRQVQGKAAGVTERVTALIRDIRKQLEALEKRVLSEISRQEEADYCDAEEDTERPDIKEVHDVRALDVGLISVTFHAGLTGIVTRISRRRQVPEASDMLLDVNTASNMLLDVNTASNYVSVSEDLKTVFWTGIKQSRPETPERFQYYRQVLSSSSFSSGRHYWEVEGSESGWWIVGMAYNSIERGGEQSLIGNNKKSWGLWRNANNQYYVRHDSNIIQLPQTSSCQRLGIFLDYEAGRLSFYELCDPIRHLHTFTAVFTEPLHAGLWISEKNTWLRIGGNLLRP
uniref:Uncharacterized protein n=1 Tax=Leptobrachium leishanense TaxID=445787 RepID=A0A8C5MIL3_9ANUR